MGGCTSLPGTSAAWDQYFERSMTCSLAGLTRVTAQWQSDCETGLGLTSSPEGVVALAAELQADFARNNNALAKTIFRAYDTDKDGYLSPSDVSSLLRDALELMTAQGAAFIHGFIAKALRQTAAALGTGAGADAAMATLRARLAVVEEEALQLHAAQMRELNAGHVALATRLILAINASPAAAGVTSPSSSGAAGAGASSTFAAARVPQVAFLPGFLPAFARAMDPAFAPLAADGLSVAVLPAAAAINAHALAYGISASDCTGSPSGSGSGSGSGVTGGSGSGSSSRRVSSADAAENAPLPRGPGHSRRPSSAMLAAAPVK